MKMKIKMSEWCYLELQGDMDYIIPRIDATFFKTRLFFVNLKKPVYILKP